MTKILKLRNELKEIYQNLELCEDRWSSSHEGESISTYEMQVGNKFPQEPNSGIIFYGRSCNGWDRSCPNGTEDNRKIYDMSIMEKDSSKSTDNEEKTMYDKKIHYAIAKASGNVLIVSILDALSEVMDIFIFEMRREILRTEKRKGMLQEAHKQIVECLLKRDVVNGQKALMKHFEMIDNIIHKEL